MSPDKTALLIETIAGMLEGLGRVAVGASSPIPARPPCSRASAAAAGPR